MVLQPVDEMSSENGRETTHLPFSNTLFITKGMNGISLLLPSKDREEFNAGVQLDFDLEIYERVASGHWRLFTSPALYGNYY